MHMAIEASVDDLQVFPDSWSSILTVSITKNRKGRGEIIFELVENPFDYINKMFKPNRKNSDPFD